MEWVDTPRTFRKPKKKKKNRRRNRKVMKKKKKKTAAVTPGTLKVKSRYLRTPVYVCVCVITS
jgi:hypothetical protein